MNCLVQLENIIALENITGLLESVMGRGMMFDEVVTIIIGPFVPDDYYCFAHSSFAQPVPAYIP
eukprot:15364352-Ditylum_brightwellii.AAC.2